MDTLISALQGPFQTSDLQSHNNLCHYMPFGLEEFVSATMEIYRLFQKRKRLCRLYSQGWDVRERFWELQAYRRPLLYSMNRFVVPNGRLLSVHSQLPRELMCLRYDLMMPPHISNDTLKDDQKGDSCLTLDDILKQICLPSLLQLLSQSRGIYVYADHISVSPVQVSAAVNLSYGSWELEYGQDRRLVEENAFGIDQRVNFLDQYD